MSETPRSLRVSCGTPRRFAVNRNVSHKARRPETFLLEFRRPWDAGIVETRPCGTLEITKDVVTIPTFANDLAEYNKKNVKAKCFLLDAVKDHLIPHVTDKKNAYEIWAALIKLFQSDNQNWKIVFREKLR